MLREIQDYLKSKSLPEIVYAVCQDEIYLPYSKDLEVYLQGLCKRPPERIGNKLAISGHGLPDYYTAYRILPDKRTKPRRVTDQTVIYKIGDVLISLVGGSILVYPKGGKLIGVGPDNPETRRLAYCIGLSEG